MTAIGWLESGWLEARRRTIDDAPSPDWWDPGDGTFDNEGRSPKRVYTRLIILAMVWLGEQAT